MVGGARILLWIVKDEKNVWNEGSSVLSPMKKRCRGREE